MEQKIKPKKSAEQALQAVMNTCARMERSEYDVLQTLRRWEVSTEDAEKILVRLTTDKFVDNSRYASAFVREKISSGRWGKHKILAALKAKRIPQHIIEEAMEIVSSDTQTANLTEILQRKSLTVNAKDAYDMRNKLFRFAMSRGYEYDEIKTAIYSITKIEDYDY